MNSITTKQRKTFFMFCNKIGRDNVYSLMHTVTGKKSTKELTFNEMRAVIKGLVKLTNTKINSKKESSPKITHNQKDKIYQLAKEIGLTPDKLQSFIEKRYNKPFPDSKKEASKLIYQLRRIRSTKWKPTQNSKKNGFRMLNVLPAPEGL